jgi:hypothetical protein
MDTNSPDKLTHTQKSIMIVLVVIMVVVIPMGYVTKVIPYFFTRMNCGQSPIETMDSLGNKTYRLPSDKGYGVSMFSSYDYCTEDQAKAAGYQHTVVNE